MENGRVEGVGITFPFQLFSEVLVFLRLGVFSPTGEQFGGNCRGVICFLKREASAKLVANRSTDYIGNVNDILNHETGTTSGTEDKENSWWSIDLGLRYQLIITNCSLRDGNMYGKLAPINWKLEGSNDGEKWDSLETIHMKDPQCMCRDRSIHQTRIWSVVGEIAPFRFFRIFQTGINSSGSNGLYLSGIELYGILLNI